MRIPLPLVGPAYKHPSLPMSAQVSKNLWPELNAETRNPVALRPTPGLKAVGTLSGRDRGAHEFNGALYMVNGTTLYRIDSDNTSTALGTIAGTGRVVMADNGTRLMIVTGATAYQYTVDNGVQAIDDPDLVNPTSVAYINSQFIFDNNRGFPGEFVTSSLLTTDFDVDGLDFATAEAHPDDIVRVMTFNQVVWFFGSRTLETWWNSGEGSPPFARMPSGVRPYGLAGTHAAVKTSEFVYWLDQDRVPRRSGGSDVQNIGNPALGAEFAKYSVIDDCIAMTWRQDHQTFVAFSFPAADRTWVYHEPSNSWFQWSYGVNDARTRASSVIRAYGLYYAADHSNGQLYLLDPCTYTDNGEVVQRRRVTAPIHGGLYQAPGMRTYYDTVEFMVSYDPCKVAGNETVEPVEIEISSLCGTSDDLNLGELLAPTALFANVTGEDALATAEDIDDQGIEYGDTSVICFTAAFATPENPGTGSVAAYSTLWLYAAYIPGSTPSGDLIPGARFEVYMDSDGYIQARGRNAAMGEVLSFTISHSGSLAGDTSHMLAFICDLTDTERREVWLDGENITPLVVWNTYENDTINLGGADGYNKIHDLGGGFGNAWGAYSGAGIAADPFITGRTCGFVSMDDSCSLVPAAIWDANGFIRDPQADFTGWYTRQPLAACTTWPLSNSGRATFTESRVFSSPIVVQRSSPYGYGILPDRAYINLDVDGNVEAEEPRAIFTPLAPPPQSTEIIAPYWNQEGTFFNFATIPTASFSAVFGVSVGGDNVAKTIDTPVALWFQTEDAGRKVRVVENHNATDVKLWVCDLDGTVISESTNEVTLPAGNAYRLVIASNTNKARVRKYYDAPPSAVNEAELSAAFAAFFGQEQQIGVVGGISLPNKYIGTDGVSVPYFHKGGWRNSFVLTRDATNAFTEAWVSLAPGDRTNPINLDSGEAVATGTLPSNPQGWYYFNARLVSNAGSTAPVSYRIAYSNRDY